MLKLYNEQYETKYKILLRKIRVIDFDVKDSITSFFPTYVNFLGAESLKLKVLSKRDQLAEIYNILCVKDVVMDLTDLAAQD